MTLKIMIRSMLKNYVPKKYLTQKQVCALTGKSPGTINDWIKTRGFPVLIFSDDEYPVYDIDDVEKYMDQFKVNKNEVKS